MWRFLGVLFFIRSVVGARVSDNGYSEEGDEDRCECKVGQAGFQEKEGEAVGPECCRCIECCQIRRAMGLMSRWVIREACERDTPC